MYIVYFIFMFTMRFFIAVLIAALALPSALGDLDIRGIPEPEFGIDEQAPQLPDPWTVETAGFYYIHRQHPQATDVNNAYGTPVRPRKTVPEDLPAGSVVEIEGTYDYSPFGYSRIQGEGTENRPIFIRGDRITRTIQVKGSYIVIEDLQFEDEDGNLNGGETGKIVVIESDHIVIRNNDVSGNREAGGIHVGSFTEESAQHVVVYNNEIHDNGDWRTTQDQDVHGIHVGRAHHVWIAENELYHNSGDGLQISAGNRNDQDETHHIYVGKNTAHDNKQTGLWTKQAVDVIFSENHAYNHEPSDSSMGACIGYQYAPHRVWFLYNELHDCTYGIGSGSDSGQGTGTDIFMIGNVIHDIHQDGGEIDAWSSSGILIAGGEDVQVLGNVIYGADAGINIPTSGEFYISSNAISDVTNNHIFIEDATGRAEWEITRNVFFGGVRVKIRNDVYTIDMLQHNFDSATRNSVQDPQIGKDGLLPSSPLFVIGENPGALEMFEDMYDIELELFGSHARDSEELVENEHEEDDEREEENEDDERNDNEDSDEEPEVAQLTNSQIVSSNQQTLPARNKQNSRSNIDDVAFDHDFYYYEPKYREPQVHDDGVSVYIIPATEENIAPESETNPLRWVFPSFLAMDLMTILLVGMVVRLPRTPKRLSGTRVRSVHEDHGKVKVKME